MKKLSDRVRARRPLYPLAACANGCDVPPAPPSLVICRACQDKITAKLELWAERGTK